jgi:hypothetical protein
MPFGVAPTPARGGFSRPGLVAGDSPRWGRWPAAVTGEAPFNKRGDAQAFLFLLDLVASVATGCVESVDLKPRGKFFELRSVEVINGDELRSPLSVGAGATPH